MLLTYKLYRERWLRWQYLRANILKATTEAFVKELIVIIIERGDKVKKYNSNN